ncbi:MAG: hypothetical protein JW737_05925 [Acidobacteria bacterium]|nr:hypothetical protein [Acidobacteriota bacterium]
MPNWAWSLLNFIIAISAALLLDIPFFIFLLVVIPVLVIVMIFLSISYSFRSSLKAQKIPAIGYKKRVKDLNKIVPLLRDHGFMMVDYFYMRIIPDVVVYALRHESEPIYYCLYHFGSRIPIDVVTRYENDMSLTTADNIEAGAAPRPEKAFLQIFRDADHDTLYINHLRSHRFITKQGVRVHDMPPANFRYYFFESFRRQADFMRKIPFWPLKLIIMTIGQEGKKFTIPIPEQYNEGQIKIW